MHYSTSASKLHGSIRLLPNGSYWLRIQHTAAPLSTCYPSYEEAYEVLIRHNKEHLLLKNYANLDGSVAEMSLSNDKWMKLDVDALPLFDDICVYARKDTNNWYAGCTIDRKTVQAHRIIYDNLKGPIPDGHVIDHIDGDTLNNRVSNLRAVSISTNVWNSKVSTNTSGVIGVKKQGSKWSATFRFNKKSHSKTLDTFDEAVAWLEQEKKRVLTADQL